MKFHRNQILVKALFVGALLSFTACSNSGNSTDETSTTSEEAVTDPQHAEHGQHAMGSGEEGGMMAHMHANMKDMQSMELTGDPDYDFATMMTKHHQGAIKMAEEELSNGTDAKMKQMAEKSITTNKAEIKELEKFASKPATTTGDTANTKKMMQAMHNMMGSMDHQSMMAGSIDQNFARMMSHHHQSGIEMAQVYLQQGKSAELKSIAQKTINEQQKEKQELDSWLAQIKQ